MCSFECHIYLISRLIDQSVFNCVSFLGQVIMVHVEGLRLRLVSFTDPRNSIIMRKLFKSELNPNSDPIEMRKHSRHIPLYACTEYVNTIELRLVGRHIADVRLFVVHQFCWFESLVKVTLQ